MIFGETISALNISPPGSFDVGDIVPGSNGVKFTADNGQGANMIGAGAGTSISSLDLNRDGFDDILIGAPRAYNVNTSSRTGEVYLLFGSPNFGGVTMGPILATDLNGIIGTTFRGFETDELAGTSVAIVDDVNGDSIRDILIGAPGKSISIDDVGVVYLFFGRSAAYSWNNVIDLEDIRNGDGSIGTEIRGTDDDDLTGISVAGAGDIDKDGFNDIIIGSPGADGGSDTKGRAHIIYGH
ncbi:MAG: integrin alpha [Rickettsiales bacterium]|nr:integrin alpha [Rickettsiales bacterium]